jgi:tetratricopeptide (TPR) repeat protein
VDSPTDILLLDAKDVAGLDWRESAIQEPACMSSAEQYWLLGNAELAKGWLLPAERSYSLGLKLDPGHIGLRLNRALVRLRLGVYRNALADAEAVLGLGWPVLTVPQLEKALYRAASALYSLQLWSQAKARFAELAAVGSKEGKKGLARINERQSEASSATYRWEDLYDRSQSDPNVDIADFVSSALAVGDVQGRGRRVVAHRNIEAGELLLMVKPVASTHETPPGLDLVTFNMPVDTMQSPDEAHLTHRLAVRWAQTSWSRFVLSTELTLPLSFGQR